MADFSLPLHAYEFFVEDIRKIDLGFDNKESELDLSQLNPVFPLE